MKKVLRPICYFLYYLIAKHLPESHSIFSLGISGKIRTLLTRGIIDSCGKSVDIEKNAKFSPHIKIGHHSGLGINSLIQENVEIGNYVMMGPNVSIYTKNHKTSLEKPMIFQGFEKLKSITLLILSSTPGVKSQFEIDNFFKVEEVLINSKSEGDKV